MKTEFNIEEFLSLDGYATDERLARRKTNNKLKIIDIIFKIFLYFSLK